MIAAPLSAGVGLLTAYLLGRTRFPGQRVFEFGTLLSFAVPGTVIGIAYVLAFNAPLVAEIDAEVAAAMSATTASDAAAALSRELRLPSSLGELGEGRQRPRVRVGQRLQGRHLRPRRRQAVGQPGLPAERPGPGAGPHPHPVLGYLVERHQPFGHQPGHQLREQVIQRRPLAGPEVRQQLVAHRHPAAQPPVGHVVQAQLG